MKITFKTKNGRTKLVFKDDLGDPLLTSTWYDTKALAENALVELTGGHVVRQRGIPAGIIKNNALGLIVQAVEIEHVDGDKKPVSPAQDTLNALANGEHPQEDLLSS